MNERQWLDSTEPTPILEFVHNTGKTSDRKMRLLAVTCCRRAWRSLGVRSRNAMRTAARFADGEVDEV
jgi:hypothetical protein